ncbi:hypothetical protein JZ751_016105 [Albula glossodonta]|uniref:Uncharacterized protein n=1 Tax=Albula glossodonta TaxID=121402 RepID=A0A8T2NZ29_9TELE|nr:hypothetical protein JZ751_016105 [Albula glossodonta]
MSSSLCHDSQLGHTGTRPGEAEPDHGSRTAVEEPAREPDRPNNSTYFKGTIEQQELHTANSQGQGGAIVGGAKLGIFGPPPTTQSRCACRWGLKCNRIVVGGESSLEQLPPLDEKIVRNLSGALQATSPLLFIRAAVFGKKLGISEV